MTTADRVFVCFTAFAVTEAAFDDRFFAKDAGTRKRNTERIAAVERFAQVEVSEFLCTICNIHDMFLPVYWM